MGCFDGAEVCEIVGGYISRKISYEINKQQFRNYHEDGLGILRNMTETEMD